MAPTPTTDVHPSTRPAGHGVDADSDGAIIARSIADPRAFTALYERHHDAVFAYAAARVGRAGAEDLVAETFIAAFGVRARFDVERGAEARPWLLGIATRRLGRHRDAERRWLRDGAAAASSSETEGGGEDGVASRVDAHRVGPHLARALDQLSRRERDPLLLHVLGDLSYDEVGAALGIPVGTVRSRVSRARTRLAGILDGVPR